MLDPVAVAETELVLDPVDETETELPSAEVPPVVAEKGNDWLIVSPVES